MSGSENGARASGRSVGVRMGFGFDVDDGRTVEGADDVSAECGALKGDVRLVVSPFVVAAVVGVAEGDLVGDEDVVGQCGHALIGILSSVNRKL